MTSTLIDFTKAISPLLNGTIAMLAAVALLVFMVGLMRYVFNSGDAKKAQEGPKLIMWGLLALFVLFAMGGILNFFASDFFGKTVFKEGSSQAPSPENAFLEDAWVGAGEGTDPDEAFDFSEEGFDFSGGGVSSGDGIITGDAVDEGECGYNANGQYVCEEFYNDCVLDEKLVRHGSSAVFYLSRTVEAPLQCNAVAQTRSCDNGVFSGSKDYKYAYCTTAGATP